MSIATFVVALALIVAGLYFLSTGIALRADELRDPFGPEMLEWNRRTHWQGSARIAAGALCWGLLVVLEIFVFGPPS